MLQDLIGRPSARTRSQRGIGWYTVRFAPFPWAFSDAAAQRSWSIPIPGFRLGAELPWCES